MKEHPILFSGPMVRAILEGRKTQTRRVIKPQPIVHADYMRWRGKEAWNIFSLELLKKSLIEYCPYGQPGDGLWVRESAYIASPDFGGPGPYVIDNEGRRRTVGYTASMDDEGVRCALDYGVMKSPSIHMPRWASRITLEVVNIRAEKVQDISEADAIAEGWEKRPDITHNLQVHEEAARDWFMDLWDSINGKKYPWSSNPWVWVVEFRRVQ